MVRSDNHQLSSLLLREDLVQPNERTQPLTEADFFSFEPPHTARTPAFPTLQPRDWLNTEPAEASVPTWTPSPGKLNLPPTPPLPGQFASLTPALRHIQGLILSELENNPLKLNTLNVSRREAIVLHLEKLSGHPGPVEGGLRRWLEGPRSSGQDLALQAYFEEVALLVLGQALLLKAWSDRGIRAWSKTDLGQLNWALSNTLRPLVPLDREGWMLSRQNIYSWYNPTVAIQNEIWVALEEWRIRDEGPALMTLLLGTGRQVKVEDSGVQPEGYDSRFLKALWEKSQLFGFDPTPDKSPLKRMKYVFSPTLREGSMVRMGPSTVSWVGLEDSPFLLLSAELVQLWWGPAAPPLWAVGNGLEVHARDQLSLALGSPKPSLVSRISEMEACDISFVLEEKIVRAQNSRTKNVDAHRFREQVEQLPYFKKIRAPGTTLGELQACVALTKLRPGGLLWWAREEPLTQNSGAGVLQFLLERGKLVCEWDYSELQHQLPSRIPAFSRYLYLFIREPRLEARMENRPYRARIRGLVRSHIELPMMLEESLSVLHKNEAHPRIPATGAHWQLEAQRSPSPQRDWVERWPDPTCKEDIRILEKLRAGSLPLASAVMVKPTPQKSADKTADQGWSVHESMYGLWLRTEVSDDGRKLIAEALPRPGNDAHGSGFMILVPDPGWVAPLCRYLQSTEVSLWLDHHAERKNDRWILSDSLVRYIPVPSLLLKLLGAPSAMEEGESIFAMPLPGEWERLAAATDLQPREVREALQLLPNFVQRGQLSIHDAARIHGTLFVRASRTAETMITTQRRLLSVVSPEGRIRWRQLLDILPKNDLAPMTFHPQVNWIGQIPPHIPITRFERVKMPQPGLLFSTELGMNTQALTENSILVDMIWDQIEGLTHPTWSELVNYVKLPRKLEVAEATAKDVLYSHAEQTSRLRDLEELIKTCQLLS